jgi:hypothetical protein
MWTGTDAEYFQLYEVSAQRIRSHFPKLMVGGPAVGGTGEFVDGHFRPAAFLTNFLAHCRDQRVPLDFFSWHRYTSDPWDLPARAAAVRRVLNEYGFERTESHLNEWNYLPEEDWTPLTRQGQGLARQKWAERMGGLESAAFAATALILLQDSSVEVANYYTGEVQSFGLLDYSGVPKTTFYAFKAFRELLDTPRRVRAQGGVEGAVAILAGTAADRNRVHVLVSNFRHAGEQFELAWDALPWPGLAAFSVFQVTPGAGLREVQRGRTAPEQPGLGFRLPAPGVALIRLEATREGEP